MARWEPNAPERLERAALALFTEQGYDATTVVQISERAGLTKSTFFRHFADKREVLSGRQGLLAERFGSAIRDAPAAATPAACLAAALESAAPGFTPDRHDLAVQRLAIVAAHSKLRERELLKLAGLATAVADALQAHGTEETTARLAAEIGVLAFTLTISRWAAPENEQPYTEIARTTLADLCARAATLDA
ncbi:helix-turn-helix domain-containing protein [Kitasatospora sp. NPDC048296]|uniref:TetR/AcrR family transcriptional regulator n=1 Tax=Kitasatospora sp. NPDC048296 TaxID=3364048 RepID=UPI00371ADA27